MTDRQEDLTQEHLQSPLSMQTPVEEGPAVGDEERPVLRPFGAPASQVSAKRWAGVSNKTALAGAVIIACAAAYTFLVPQASPKAPEMKTEVAKPHAGVTQVAAAASVPTQASQATAAASVPDVAASAAALNATQPKTYADALSLIEKLKKDSKVLEDDLLASRQRVAELEAAQEERSAAQEKKASAKAAPSKKPAAQAKNLTPDDFIAVTVMDISDEAVVVSDATRKYKVLPGGQLPGGATYIGYDTAAHLMKTDQGDFFIP